MAHSSWICNGCLVTGSHRPLQPNPTTKGRIRMQAVGTVMSAAGPNMWDITFNFDVQSQTLNSRYLKIVPDGTANL